jgi:cobalamin biosynthesis Mg chelatase CobN
MLEANGRNFWKPSEEILMQLKDLYDEIEDEIEGM